jgi:hypothetical protein
LPRESLAVRERTDETTCALELSSLPVTRFQDRYRVGRPGSCEQLRVRGPVQLRATRYQQRLAARAVDAACRCRSGPDSQAASENSKRLTRPPESRHPRPILLDQLLLHAEPRASHGFHRRIRPTHLDLCRDLPTEEVEQHFAWRSGDAGSRFPQPCSNGLSSPRPLKLQTCAVQSPREKPGRQTDVAPQGLVQCRFVRSRTTTVGSAYVLVVDEEFVKVRKPAYPSDAEQAWRRSRSNRRNEPCKVPQRERSSSSFSEAAPSTRQHKPGTSEVVALAEDEVRREIAGRPRLEESWCLGTELVEQVAELCSLDGVKEHIGHIAVV